MSHADFIGKWRVHKATGEFKPLVEKEWPSFTITGSATAAGATACTVVGGVGNDILEEVLMLEAVPYHAKDNVLRGTCAGKVAGGDHAATKFHVFVVCCPTSPLTCSGVAFAADDAAHAASAGGIGEDNSVGSWTAIKQGGDSPPPAAPGEPPV